MRSFKHFLEEKIMKEGIMDFFGGGKPSSGSSVSGAITLPGNNMTGGMAMYKGNSAANKSYPKLEFSITYKVPTSSASKDVIALLNKSQGKSIPVKVQMPELDAMSVKGKGLLGGSAKKFGTFDGSISVSQSTQEKEYTIRLIFIMDAGLSPDRFNTFSQQVGTGGEFSFLNRKPGPHKSLQVIA